MINDNKINSTLRYRWSGILHAFEHNYNIHNIEQYIGALFVIRLVSNYFKNYESIIQDNLEEKNSLFSKHQEYSHLIEYVDFDHILTHREVPSVGDYINNALNVIENIYTDQLFNSFKDLDFRRIISIRRHSLSRMLKIVDDIDEAQHLNGYIKHQRIIESFENFLFFCATKEQSGNNYNTIPFLISIVTKLMKINNGDTLYDPTANISTLVVNLFKNNKLNNFLPYLEEKSEANYFLSRINMFMHGISNAKIECGDFLVKPTILDNTKSLQLFDKVVAILPLSLSNWGSDLAQYDKYNRFRFGIPPRNFSDYAYLSHMIASLKPGGTICCAVPSGVLFREKIEGQIRKKIVEENLVDTVIVLPMIRPFRTNIIYSILILKKDRTNNDILFIDASDLYVTTSMQEKIIKDQHINEIIKLSEKRESMKCVSYLASFTEVQQNRFNLHPNKYVQSPVNNTDIEIDNLREGISEAQSKLEIVQKRIQKLNNEFIRYIDKNMFLNLKN